MKTVVITGANRGLGLEFVRQYLNDNATVYAICRSNQNNDELITLSHNKKVVIIIADLLDQKSIDRVALELSNVAIDILINNAGIFGPKAQADGDLRQSFGHMNYEKWLEILRINTLAPYKLAEVLINNMKLGNDKKIITLSGTAGSISEVQASVNAYRSSKCAVNMVMASLAKELQSDGIIIGLICPGWVNTRMGGDQAPIKINESVTGMREVIDDLTIENSGSFYRYNGDVIPW
jgi:NAD(P)-dependent dehydrogenase (short-subunit alcohol dehydrogenase family)